MESRRKRATSRFIVAAVIALSSTFGTIAVATAAENDCRKTPVHTLVCYLVNDEPIDRVRDLLCLVSQELCT